MKKQYPKPTANTADTVNSIAYNILAVNEDCEECVNDTLMKAWNAIPPQKPRKLCPAFLGRINTQPFAEQIL